MKNKKIEKDRTPSKTACNSSNLFSPDFQKGFTLIELLVVISIIALLSTIVLAAVNDARVKARNTAKNSLVLEYVKALELYRNDHNGSYPVSSTNICFGYSSTEKCYANSYSGSDSIKSSMQNYLAGDFAHRGSVPYGSDSLNGVQYICTGSTSCTSYSLIWLNEKENQKCISNQSGVNSLNNTRCMYTPQ